MWSVEAEKKSPKNGKDKKTYGIIVFRPKKSQIHDLFKHPVPQLFYHTPRPIFSYSTWLLIALDHRRLFE